MAELVKNFAPYAPAASLERVIEHHRELGLVNPVTLTALERIGIPASMASRTLQALRFLDLVEEDGTHREGFDRIRKAASSEYPDVMREIIQATYLPVFSSIDPATATDLQVTDAFRGFEPSAQREKMIALFRGLCAMAGLIEGAPRRRGAGRRRPPRKPPENSGNGTGGRGKADHADPPPPPPPLKPDYQLITSICAQLPSEGQWSAERRARWIQAMTAAVDLLIGVEEPNPAEQEAE